MEPSGALWPNGEFTVGYAPCGGLERELTAEEWAAKSVPPIGLAMPANSHTGSDVVPAPRGTGGLTSYGRRLVRNSVEMMERAYGATNLSFVTLTLPKLEYEEYWNVSSNWSQICRVYYQAVGRMLGRKLLPPWYVGVTELQPGRTQREEVPALHIHHLCVGRRRNEKGWRVKPAEYRELWQRAVSPYLFNEYDWSACERVEGIRYTAAGYISKYMSKGDDGAVSLPRTGTGWSLPTAWYNVSLRLKRRVVEKVRRDPRLLEYIECAARDGSLERECDYFYAGTIEAMSGTGPHYFVGRIKKDAMEQLIDVWRCVALDKIP